MRAKAILEQAFGDLDQASDVLERLAEAVRAVNDAAPDDTMDEPARGSIEEKPAARGTRRAAPRRSK